MSRSSVTQRSSSAFVAVLALALPVGARAQAQAPEVPGASPRPAGGDAPGVAEPAASEAAAEPAVTESAAPPAPVQEVTVSGTRIGRLRDEAPAAISLVTRGDLKKRLALTFDEGLRREPGVFLLKYRAPVDNHSITVMRGLTGQNRTLTMLDGIPLNGVAGGEIPWANLPVDAVDRIEVGRGPFSALYGGHAMAGVVNAGTITPQADTASVRTGYGSNSSYQLAGQVGTRVLSDRLAVLAGVERYDSAGYEVQETRKSAGTTDAMPGDPVVTGWTASTDAAGNPQYVIGSPGRNAFTRDTYFGKLAYELSRRSTLSVLGMYGRWTATNPEYRTALRDAEGNPVTSGTVNIDGKRISLSENDFNPIERFQDAGVVGARLVHDLGGGDTLSSMIAFTHQMSEEVEFRAVPVEINPSGRNWTTRRTRSQGVIADVSAAVKLGRRNTLTAGAVGAAAEGRQRIPLIVGRHERTERGELADLGGRQLTGALYAQDELRIRDDVRLYGGLRLDAWHMHDGFRELPPEMEGAPSRVDFASRTQLSVNPKLSAVYLPSEGSTLRASIGTAFRPPTITELYGGSAHAGTQTLGNPDLRPERTLSIELGAVKRLGRTTRAAATLFQNHIDRLIFARTLSEPGAPVTVRMQDNAAEVRARGLELELRQAVVDGVELFGNYTFTRSTFLSFPNNPAAEGKRLPNVPEHMLNAGVDARIGKLQGLVTFEGVSDAFAREDNTDVERNVPQGLDPYWVIDAKVAYQLTRRVRGSVAGQNLLDKDYFLGFGRSAGRTFFADVAVSLR